MIIYINDEQTLINRWLNKVSEGEYFANKTEAVKLTELWRSLCFGEKQGEILVMGKTGDDKKKKKSYQEEAIHRENVTNSKTPYVFNRLKTVFLEVDRADGKKDIIELNGEEESKEIRALNDKMSMFHGEMDVDDYLDERFADWLCVEPNSFLLIDFYSFDHITEKASSYPLHIPVADVRDFQHHHGLLQYLAFQTKANEVVTYEGESHQVELTIEWLYTDKSRFKLFRKPKGYELKPGESIVRLKRGKSEEAKIYDTQGNAFDVYDLSVGSSDELVDYVIDTSMDAGFTSVPAMRIGQRPHPEYKNLADSLLRPARERFIDLAQKKSNFDVTMALHGIAQKFVYVERCDYRTEKGLRCESGYIGGDVCPSCEGTAEKKLHKSEFDVITLELKLDESGISQPIDLSQLVHYAEYPQAVIDKHHEVVKEYEADVSLGLFNTNIFNREQLVAATATEIKANLTPVNNVLYTQYARPKSQLWEFVVRHIAHNAQIGDRQSLKIMRQYPTDFGLESYQELLTYLKEAKASNAPRFIIRDFEVAIMKKLHKDDVEAVSKMMVIERYKPYNDRSEADKLQSLSQLPEYDPKRILNLYFDDIVRDIELQEPYFYRMPHDTLTIMFEEKANEYMAKYQSYKDASLPPDIDVMDVEIEEEEDETEVQ